jgi:hypothetical protein
MPLFYKHKELSPGGNAQSVEIRRQFAPCFKKIG